MNLNRYTKAELINKLKSQNDSTNSKQSKQNSPTFIDLILKFKFWILSLSIVSILMKIFKNYKSIRAILKLANYIIITIFGMSVFEAFGFGFLLKFLGELKYIFGAVVTYLTNLTFYNYLMSIFNAVEDKESIRNKYKKPIEVDWKAEYEKAERQREIEKWKNKYEFHKENNEKSDMKTIALLLLLLGGTIATWYYGPELLNIFSPIWNMRDVIKKILRGGRNNDDDSPTMGAIELDPDIRTISPDMLVYSSDKVEKSILDKLPQNHPAKFSAPPAPEPPPIPSTEQGKPTGLLESIRAGKKLKPTETIVKDTSLKGKVDFGEASSSKVTLDSKSENKMGLSEHLLSKFEKLRPMITGDDSELEESKSGQDWDASGETTPTNVTEMSTNSDKKQKFLDSIKLNRENKATSSKISPALKPIMENFPNLTTETLEKLSTVEGIRDRMKILDSLSEEELKPNVTPFKQAIEDIKILKPELSALNKVINKYNNKSINDINEDDRNDIEKIINKITPDTLIEEFKDHQNKPFVNSLILENVDHSIKQILAENPQWSKQQLIEKLISENPLHKDQILSKVSITMNEQLDIWERKFSAKDFNKLKKRLTIEDMKELESLGENKTTDQIKTVVSINKSHANLLNEIKTKKFVDKSKEPSFEANEQIDNTLQLFD